jgi:hypothetical protein
LAVQISFFKLEEEGSAALLLHLPKLKAKDCIFASAVETRCRLVVEIAQAALFSGKRG